MVLLPVLKYKGTKSGKLKKIEHFYFCKMFILWAIKTNYLLFQKVSDFQNFT
jgi:hypothetical protein